MNEEEKKAIERLKTDENQIDGLCEDIIESRNSAINTVLNLMTKLQKENEEKDKIIYEIARSNVKLKGYEIEEKYIDTTIRFFTKYVKNLERNPQWRNDKNE